MGLKEDFEKAAEEIKAVNVAEQNDMLELYGLFKQANMGDNTTDKPGMLDFKGKAKWEAWTKQKGVSQEDAMKQYIELVEKLKTKYAAKQAA